MGEAAYEDGRDESARRWYGAIEWGGLLALGFSLYELTDQPAVGTAVVCLKFGWRDFRTAHWLWRADPRRPRGRACWWLYVGWGLMKVGLVAVGTCLAVLVGIVVMTGLRGWQAVPPGFEQLMLSMAGGALTALAALQLSAIAAACALRLAVRHRLSLWLNSSVGSARRRGVWPPMTSDRPGRNCLERLQLPAIPSTFFCIYLGSLTVMLQPFSKGPPDGVVFVLVMFAGIGLALGAAVACWYYCVKLVPRSVHADSPAECWPPDELAAWPDEQP
jgi:hypothetical protein